MQTLASFIDRREPARPEEACSSLAERFAADPDAMAVAVVENGKPLGLVSRDVFMALRGQSANAMAKITVAAVMDRDPLIVDAGAPVGDFIDGVLATRPQALGRGVIVVENGRYAGLAGAATLVAARRARKAAARQASALIEELSVGIGRHLDTLIGFAERLNRQSLPPDAAAWVRAISETSGELRDLTADARELHWAQSERLVLRPAPCRLRDLADRIDDRWSGHSPRVMVSYDGDPTAAALLDADRVAQCFDALIHRAANAGAAGVIEATLTAMQSPRGLILECAVRAEAPGAFDDGLLSAESGADLSLRLRTALAARTLTAMGGKLSAGGTASGGARAAFRLEVTRAKAESPLPPEPRRVGDRPVQVLVVDDNPTNRMVAESLCSLFGCVCQSATDGLEAVAAVRERPFDVILMDIRMPRMDGIEATRVIRALPGLAGATPILALTANADPSDLRRYLEAGMQGAVEKPVKAEKLAQALDSVIARSGSLRAAG